MWVKVLLDAAGALLVGGAVLLWIWLWEIHDSGDPWYLMPNIVGIAFGVSVVFMLLGILLLRRKEIKEVPDDAGFHPTAAREWGAEPPTAGLPPEEAEPLKTGNAAAPSLETQTGPNGGQKTQAGPVPHQSPMPGHGEDMPGGREEAAVSPYIILGVHESDTLEMIREVYEGLEAAYHPGRHPDASEYSRARKAAQLLKIKSAYEWICAHHVSPSFRPAGKAAARRLYREACELVNVRKYGPAMEAISEAIALDPADAAFFSLQGTVLSRLFRYGDAVEAFTRAIEMGADDARIFNQRGLAHAQMGNDALAIEDYGRAIKKDPKFSDAFNNRGIVFKKTGDHRAAIEDLNSAIQLDPAFAEAHTLRGLVYGELGGHQSKVEDFKAAARLGSAFAQRYLNEKGVEW